MRIVLCDRCGARITGGIFKLAATDEDFCFDCSRSIADPACQHEDNADGTTNETEPGKRHLVCKNCGYDRLEIA